MHNTSLSSSQLKMSNLLNNMYLEFNELERSTN
jgi:hypothetical protein